MPTKQIDIQTLDHIAHLARIGLTPEEKQKFLSQLSSILEYVAVLQTVDTSATPPSFQVTDLKNVTRPDEAGTSLSRNAILSQAPKSKDSYFQVHNTIKK
jgi:aspartyl-tRNA(Asn)/glutamyl-tRNA(Gln) amidotransferase subunit C